MATNPMQRKTRNSFLLGMLLMLLISGVIIALLFMQLMNKVKKEQEELQLSVKAYVLNQDVSSGQIITNDMLELKTVNRTLVPSNATSDLSIIETYSFQDKEGNNIYSKMNNDEQRLFVRRNNIEYEVKKEEYTENYYIERANSNNNNSDDKQYIELNSVPLVAKVTMKKNTIITTELLSKSDNVVQADTRKQEYNMLVLPMDLASGDYIDIRFMLPSGQDYIVVSKKEVEVPNINGIDVSDTIWVNMTEDEILHMSCAIVEAYQINGSKLYATKYTEAGMQTAAITSYPINGSTAQLLLNNPNILERAKNEINARYSEIGHLRNDFINNVINSQGDQAQSNLEANMQESITNSKGSRKEYLDSLGLDF